MELLAALLLSALVVVASALWFVQIALSPTIPIKGKTNVPGNPLGRTWPIIGDGLIFLGIWNMEGFMDLLDRILKASSNSVVSLWIGAKLVIFVKDPEITETITNSPKASNKDRDFYKAFAYFSDGFFAKNGKEWADMRKRADVELPPKHVDKYLNIFDTKFKLLCDEVDRKVGKGTFDMLDSMKHLAVDILLESLYGVPSDQFTNNTMDFPVYSVRAIELIFLQMMKIEYRVSWLFPFLAGGRESKSIKKNVHIMTKYIVDSRNEEFAKTGIYPGDPHFVPANYADAVLQYGKSKNWSDVDLDALLDVLVAGADTTAMVTSALSLYLAMYPEYQEKAYQEQIEVMGDSLDAPSIGDLAKMSYLNMVFNETLRIAGVPAYIRVLTSEIRAGGYIFPEGSCVLFAIRDMMKNSKYWERPDEFYPDHFCPEMVEKRPKGVFLPFSSGPRSCAGKNYAEISCKVGFSMLLRRFRFTTNLKFEELTYKYMLLTECAQGYPVEAIRRPIKTWTPLELRKTSPHQEWSKTKIIQN
ncbi:hypothetical protein GE061_013757 [Apolygus lucorum]|uniref:Uncharacterized protein n=1 Tax=Apolygus lucorum TaxID=248454 RepID=A0A6A4K133_APOLU|nr:hypothetical protein GE061_013757 [Apolygus lucorum]